MSDLSKKMQGMNKMSNLQLDRAIRMPKLELPRMPSIEEQHEYESSGELIRRLSITVKRWQKQIQEDAQPVILAVMANGVSIRVDRLIQEGHNGVIVEGLVDDSPCLMIVHQATLQLLCYVEQIDKPDEKRAPIGFRYHGQEQDDENQPGS